MQFLTQFKNLNSGTLAVILFISVFPLKHFLSMLYAFEDINLIFLNKIVKYLITAVFSFFLIKEIVKKKVKIFSPQLYLYAIFVLIIGCKLLWYRFSIGYIPNYFTLNFNSLIGGVGFFLLGIYFPINLQKFNLVSLFLVYILQLFITFLNINYSQFQLAIYWIENPGLRSDYLMWADSFAISSLLLIFSVEKICRYFFVIIGFGLMLTYFSRASLFSYSFAILVGLCLVRDYKGIKILIFLLVFLIIAAFFNDLSMRAIKMGLSSNSSHSVRLDILKNGLSDIKNNWLLGNFLGQLTNIKYNELGHYIHNYLSIWRQFGLLPFLVFAFYYVSAAHKFVIQKIEPQNIGVIIFILVQVTFFRAYTFPYFWMIAGLVASRSIFLDNKDI